MPVKGAKSYLRRMRELYGPRLDRQLGAALFSGGEMIQVEAQNSITRGAVSGKDHVASPPGEPPNNDTGVLANNIETLQPKPLKVFVKSNASYSTDLERGTSKIAARPFFRPARDKMRPEVEKLVNRAFQQFIRSTKQRSEES